jgi:antitoxin HicB
MIARQYTFTVVLEPDQGAGGFALHVPALPGCHTEGDTREEAVAMAQDAITAYVESLIKHNEPIPVEADGFIDDHQTGSHLVLRHPVSRLRAVDPIHRGDL